MKTKNTGIILGNCIKKIEVLNSKINHQCIIVENTKKHFDDVKKIILDIMSDLDVLTIKINIPAYGQAIQGDLLEWLNNKCKTRPNFEFSRDKIEAPKNGDIFFFFGPIRLANGGKRSNSCYKFELFLSLRDEPISQTYTYLYQTYPHPKNICQSSKLITGTSGIMEGNNIVFFPENILANSMLPKQKYAIFFFNKFFKIYNEITISLCEIIGLGREIKYSNSLSQEEMYHARCVWGYLHDYFHHLGSRAFDENIAIKTKWHTGLLEEIKVDLQTLLLCMNDDDIPYFREVYEFILFDRIFRYPTEKNWSNNFDSGTGLLLISYLYTYGVITIKNKKLILEHKKIKDAFTCLVKEIERIEKFDDKNYMIYAKQIVFKRPLHKPTQNPPI